jgi:hypothetical protein
VENIIAQLPPWKAQAEVGDESYKADELFQFFVLGGKLAAQGRLKKSAASIDDTHAVVITMKNSLTLNATLKYADEADVSGVVELDAEC